jgi:hypothetical protein
MRVYAGRWERDSSIYPPALTTGGQLGAGRSCWRSSFGRLFLRMAPSSSEAGRPTSGHARREDIGPRPKTNDGADISLSPRDSHGSSGWSCPQCAKVIASRLLSRWAGASDHEDKQSPACRSTVRSSESVAATETGCLTIRCTSTPWRSWSAQIGAVLSVAPDLSQSAPVASLHADPL